MDRYVYDGPVEEFGKCVSNRWTATTYAVSEAKARSNFEYQFKKQFNRGKNVKITLPGIIARYPA